MRVNQSETDRWRNKIVTGSFVSVMNDTRWSALLKNLADSDLRPRFRVKIVDKAAPNDDWERSFPYHLPSPLLCIEWLELSAISYEHRGQLIPPLEYDRSALLEECLRTSKVPFTQDGAVYKVWGHLAPGVAPVFA